MNKRWNLLYENADKEKIKEIELATGLSHEVSSILAIRGIEKENANAFLHEKIDMLADPFSMKDMRKAVYRIENAILAKERITVYGDYDVDGVSSTVMLVKYLREKGAECDYYIPFRMSDGYGVNNNALDSIAKNGTSLIITVDTGISAINEVEYAKTLGIDVVITDHHSIEGELPNAIAVVNPKRSDCTYPYKDFAGAGVVFKLLCALEGNTRKIITDYCDLATLATITDIVPLTGENRAISAFGMRKIKKMPSVGFKAVCENAGIDYKTITSGQIGFSIAPRLNAAGRVDNAAVAAELLLTEDEEKAAELAEQLNVLNTHRKELGQQILQEAVEKIESRDDIADKKVIIVGGDGWHQGVIGITASQLCEQYNKTVLLISYEGESGNGSGRAVEGFNLFEALCESAHLIEKFGGHASAAGITIKRENEKEIEKMMNAYADANAEAILEPCVNIDLELPLEKNLIDFANETAVLEPYGEKNKPPVFALMNATVTNIRVSRDEKHIFIKVRRGLKWLDCAGFRFGHLKDEINIGDTVDVAGELVKNSYNYMLLPQLNITDIRKR